MIDNQLYDDVDINRELKCLFVKTNLLTIDALHAVLNRSSCVYFEHTVCVFISLWTNYHSYSLQKFTSA